MSQTPVTKCCYFCSLKTGTKFIGWIYLIISTYFLILLKVASISNEPLDEVERVTPVVYLVTTTGLSAMLLVGIYTNKAELVGAWLVLNVIKTTLFFVLIFFVTVAYRIVFYNFYPTIGLPLIVLVIDSCTIWAVHKFDEETRKRKLVSDHRTTTQL